MALRYALFSAFILLSCNPAPALEIKSGDFSEGGYIPSRYTCDAQNISPALKWTDVPAGTKSFALISDDPDAPAGTWSHWVAFNIPAQASGLTQNFPVLKESGGIIQGLNDFGKTGYCGPCPPAGRPHRYFFRLYALDSMLELGAQAKREDVLAAANGHVLAEADTFGLYAR